MGLWPQRAGFTERSINYFFCEQVPSFFKQYKYQRSQLTTQYKFHSLSNYGNLRDDSKNSPKLYLCRVLGLCSFLFFFSLVYQFVLRTEPGSWVSSRLSYVRSNQRVCGGIYNNLLFLFIF